MLRRTQAVNGTKIKYLSVADSKIYKVTNIDFRNLTIEATEANLTIADVPENEVFPIEEFGEFKIRLRNGCVTGVIVNIGEWMTEHRMTYMI